MPSPNSKMRTAYFMQSTIADIIISRYYPDKLKHAKVIPIFKSDDEAEVSNYRSISQIYLTEFLK